MASTLKHIRSSTANKRPTASGLADGQIALNTASGTPALFFKNNNGQVVKVGPAHVGTTAPNAVPAGSAGNSLGELWVNNSLTTPGLNYYTGSAFVNLTPSGTTTTVGLVELATPAETQTGTDGVRAVTPSGLQSKVSDSTSTTSSTTIASSTAVKSAYDLANAALPKVGGTLTGVLLIGTTGGLTFEGSTDDSFETTITVVDPTADRTIAFPNISGTVVTTGDTGTVTSTMIADGAIVNADINSAAAIAGTKISPDFGSQNVTTTGTSTAASFIPSSSTAPTNGIYLPAANSVGISTNSSERLRITSSGLVGIGTASPNAPLHVVSTSAGYTTTMLALGEQSIATGKQLFLGMNTTDAKGYIQSVHWGTGYKELLLNPNGGSVGIGTSSVTGTNTRLEVSNDSAEIKVSSAPAYNANFRGIRFGVTGDSVDYSGIRFQPNSGELRTEAGFALWGGLQTFYTNGLERVRIDSSGRLLVGTSSDSGGALLQVNGNRIRVATAKTPSSASDTGTTGEICWDASYIYVCTATNTWKRTAISTW